jgi:hypothetical protein
MIVAKQNTYHLVNKDIIIDPMLPPAVTYFFMKDVMRKKDWAIEVLFSREYDTEWSFNEDNWRKAEFDFSEFPQTLN